MVDIQLHSSFNEWIKTKNYQVDNICEHLKQILPRKYKETWRKKINDFLEFDTTTIITTNTINSNCTYPAHPRNIIPGKRLLDFYNLIQPILKEWMSQDQEQNKLQRNNNNNSVINWDLVIAAEEAQASKVTTTTSPSITILKEETLSSQAIISGSSASSFINPSPLRKRKLDINCFSHEGDLKDIHNYNNNSSFRPPPPLPRNMYSSSVDISLAVPAIVMKDSNLLPYHSSILLTNQEKQPQLKKSKEEKEKQPEKQEENEEEGRKEEENNINKLPTNSVVNESSSSSSLDNLKYAVHFLTNSVSLNDSSSSSSSSKLNYDQLKLLNNVNIVRDQLNSKDYLKQVEKIVLEHGNQLLLYQHDLIEQDRENTAKLQELNNKKQEIENQNIQLNEMKKKVEEENNKLQESKNFLLTEERDLEYLKQNIAQQRKVIQNEEKECQKQLAKDYDYHIAKVIQQLDNNLSTEEEKDKKEEKEGKDAKENVQKQEQHQQPQEINDNYLNKIVMSTNNKSLKALSNGTIEDWILFEPQKDEIISHIRLLFLNSSNDFFRSFAEPFVYDCGCERLWYWYRLLPPSSVNFRIVSYAITRLLIFAPQATGSFLWPGMCPLPMLSSVSNATSDVSKIH